MKKDYTHIGMLIDRSGSMTNLKAAMEEAYAGFIYNQKRQPGTATFSLVEFDNETTVLHWFQDLSRVPEHFELIPRDSTALYDALGEFIIDTGKKLVSLPEDQRPSKVVVLILTDGEENASREFSSDNIKKMIEEQQNKYSWEFIFMGANQDAVLEAKKIGINSNNSITFGANRMGVRNAVASATHAVSQTRTGNFNGFSDEDRKQANSG